MKEISSQMTGRFSSPEHALMQGRNQAVNGVPQSTASFKLKIQHGSSLLKSDEENLGGSQANESLQESA